MAGKRTKATRQQTPNKGAGPAQVLPYLFVGPQNTTEPSIAAAAGITHIISLGCRPKHNEDKTANNANGAGAGDANPNRLVDIAYHHIGIQDKTEADLSTAALLVADIISNARSRQRDGGEAKVLVHCMGGVSRSPSVLAYYLMREEGMSLRGALGIIMKARPATRPNDGFLRQLKEMEMELRGECTMEEVESLPLETRKRSELLLGADDMGEKPIPNSDE
ncbi:protein-tyrosine phosphatase-like protein [Apiospora marii]|uniref:Protein-tyrosine phosphatase-like protein n=1 Tax=Apiospora marii TaxID=335849 RepID=A0ABR1RBG7_9PEZI